MNNFKEGLVINKIEELKLKKKDVDKIIAKKIVEELDKLYSETNDETIKVIILEREVKIREMLVNENFDEFMEVLDRYKIKRKFTRNEDSKNYNYKQDSTDFSK